MLKSQQKIQTAFVETTQPSTLTPPSDSTWKTNLFLVIVAAAVGTYLTKWYQDKMSDTATKHANKKETQTKATAPSFDKQTDSNTRCPMISTDKKSILHFKHKRVPRSGEYALTFEQLSAYSDASIWESRIEQRFLAATEASATDTHPNDDATFITETRTQSPELKSMETHALPLNGKATAGFSNTSSYDNVPSRATSKNEDLDMDQLLTPDNSKEVLRDEIEKRKRSLLALVEDDRAEWPKSSTTTPPATTNFFASPVKTTQPVPTTSWIPWPFKQ